MDLGQISGCVSGEPNRSLEPWWIKTKYKNKSHDHIVLVAQDSPPRCFFTAVPFAQRIVLPRRFS